jgi:hypothetical protein
MKARKSGEKVEMPFRMMRRSNVSKSSPLVPASLPPTLEGADAASTLGCPPAEVGDSPRKNAEETIRSVTPRAIRSELSSPRP